MGPAKTKILSGIVAGVAAAASFPFTFFAFFSLLRVVDLSTAVSGMFAIGCGLVAGVVVLLSVYDGLCLRWSSEIQPPRFPPWSTRRIRDFLGI